MGDNKWSSQRRASRNAKKQMISQYNREYLTDDEEFSGSENYKSKKKSK